jgi:RHS repeat-associated protein
MPTRHESSAAYRYGFNGKENDNTIKGTGNSVDFGARMYDSRLGRWFAIDPLARKYPMLSPYAFVANNPLIYIDPDGKDIILVIEYTYHNNKNIKNIHDLGHINASEIKISYKFNNKTKSIDIVMKVYVNYHPLFQPLLTDNLESENPGLLREVTAHEKGHANQFFDELKLMDVNIMYNGKQFKGKADKVLTDILKKMNSDLIDHINKMIKQKKFKTQKELNKYIKTAKKKLNKEYGTIFKKIIQKFEQIIKNKFFVSKEKTKRIEADANKRAFKELGESTIKYLNRKMKIKHNGKIIPND